MLAARIRSGLVETVHDGAVAVVADDGKLVAAAGDIDQPFFLRSAAKPFQAMIAQQEGAGLSGLQLALAAASHDGEPVQIALVEAMLSEVGLDGSDLQCPAAWPLSASAATRYRQESRAAPERVWHNCSGKHASWLRACQSNDWSLDSYLSPGHPLQEKITDLISDLGQYPTTPVGVDGCGAPVHRTTTRAMALLYARLASAPLLREVFAAMHRYPALVSGSANGDTQIATALNAAAKRGAAGCLGVALEGRLGIAVKAWDGIQEVADSAMVATLSVLGELSGRAEEVLTPLARPQVLGGGRSVGELEPKVELKWA